MDMASGAARLECQAKRIAAMLRDATPPPDMAAAPVAPARGPQVMIPDYQVLPSGMRRRTGGHFQDAGALEVEIGRAAQRHDASGSDRPFVAPYTLGQIGIARDYRSLTEWREGSPLRCASLEAGRGGGGSGLFIDSYIQRGRWLAVLQARIGTAWALRPRRHMDRGNARRPLSDRALVDLVVLGGADLSAVLRAYGWSCKGDHRAMLRASLCAALDRMQGLDAPSPQHGVQEGY